jgi:hypothetical protein
MQLDWGPFTEEMRWWSAGRSPRPARRGLRAGGHDRRRGLERGLAAPAPDTIEASWPRSPARPSWSTPGVRRGPARAARGRPAPRRDYHTDRGYFGLDPEHLSGIEGLVHVDRIGR